MMRYGSQLNPANRFEQVARVPDFEHVEWDQEYLESTQRPPIEYLFDDSQSIISENSSPDIPFRYSLNPYRGCVHGCSYCYARPTHEYLGLNAGFDFETKVVVKRDAAKLFRAFLGRKYYEPDAVNFSGVTDCYQPAEREFRLTRACLEVADACGHPVRIITKNALVTRDVDLLRQMAQRRLVHVFLSITTLDPQLARDMEPRTSIPAARLRAIQILADAGVPVGVMAAPIIPGLNESELPAILAAAKESGAHGSSYTLLRLPLTVEPVFDEWLQRTQPLKRDRILNSVRETRGGALNVSQFGERMRGTGPLAEQIRQLFQVFQKKHGLDGILPEFDYSQFRPPGSRLRQLELFD